MPNSVEFYMGLGFEVADALFDKLADDKNGLTLLQLVISKRLNKLPEVNYPWYKKQYLPWIAHTKGNNKDIFYQPPP